MKKSFKTEIDKKNQSLWDGRFSNSAKVAAEAVKILKKSEKEGYLKGIAYSKLNIAAGNFLQSKTETALKYLTESNDWFENNREEKGYARYLLLKGNILESFGDYEKTLSLWLQAYEAAQKIHDIESEGEACSQLGLIYSRLCNFDKALEFFNKGLKIREKLGDENAAASSLNRIGMVLRQTGKYDEALTYYFRSLEIREKNWQKSAIPWTLLGIANTYEDMKLYPDALKYYEKAIPGGDKRCVMQCLLGAGRVFSCTGDAVNAEQRLLRSLSLAKELSSMVLIADAYAALATHYEHYKKPDKALKNYKLFLKARETFQSSEVQSRLSNIEIAHAVEKSEQEKEIYRLRHIELKNAYDIIEEKNKDITDSINYASRIQQAILPDIAGTGGLSSKMFILYLPKDIVSGDFYWFADVSGKFVLVAGDCTGHGVPGALMSMLGISFLEDIVNEKKVLNSAEILDELRNEVQRALHQTGSSEDTKDGLDIALCVINKHDRSIQYSGAFNNLYLVSKGELKEYEADRMPIGISDKINRKFSSQDIPFQARDIIYMFSDGFADQFGGANQKKFKYSAFKELLFEIHKLPIKEQRKRLEAAFRNWKGDNPQTDDILVIGLKL